MDEIKTDSNSMEPIPLSGKVKVALPSAVSLNTSFQKLKVEVPGIFDLSSIEHLTFNRPSIQKLKTEFILQQTSYSEVKKVFEKERRKIREQHPNELASFNKRLYQFKLKVLIQLEKVFSSNPKMTSIIYSIKRQYE